MHQTSLVQVSVTIGCPCYAIPWCKNPLDNISFNSVPSIITLRLSVLLIAVISQSWSILRSEEIARHVMTQFISAWKLPTLTHHAMEKAKHNIKNS
jgi:hypothetical protein